MSQRHDYIDDEVYDVEPDECKHPPDLLEVVIDSIGEVTKQKHSKFIECTNCGAKIDEESSS